MSCSEIACCGDAFASFGAEEFTLYEVSKSEKRGVVVLSVVRRIRGSIVVLADGVPFKNNI